MNRPYQMARPHECQCPQCRADRLYTLRGAWELAKSLFVLGLFAVAALVLLALAAPPTP